VSPDPPCLSITVPLRGTPAAAAAAAPVPSQTEYTVTALIEEGIDALGPGVAEFVLVIDTSGPSNSKLRIRGVLRGSSICLARSQRATLSKAGVTVDHI